MVSGACLVVSDVCPEVSGGRGLPLRPFHPLPSFPPRLPFLHLHPMGLTCQVRLVYFMGTLNQYMN